MARVEHDVEKLLQTYFHIRVMKVLASAKTPCTKYTVAKTSGVNHRTVDRILKTLVEHSWVVKHPYKPVKYSVNTDNPIVKKLVEFMEEAGYIN
ncbi:MAG: hypothetical protein RMK31_05520 [Candidatus Caldarchaeum sp.]|nr:hypothetical protein [Candidatus Caldarchaeum sp.]